MYNGNTEGEKAAARRLVKLILSDGTSMVSVHDGEEWACKKESDYAAVIDAMGNTGEDTLRVWGEDGRKGAFMLVWGNREDGSELISDFSDNEYGNSLWEEWNKYYG